MFLEVSRNHFPRLTEAWVAPGISYEAFEFAPANVIRNVAHLHPLLREEVRVLGPHSFPEQVADRCPRTETASALGVGFGVAQEVHGTQTTAALAVAVSGHVLAYLLASSHITHCFHLALFHPPNAPALPGPSRGRHSGHALLERC